MRRTARARWSNGLHVVQILPEIRAEQVERIRGSAAIGALYFSTNYDLHGTSVPPNAKHVSTHEAARTVLTCGASVLEIPEPLWLREFPRSAVLAACYKIGRGVRGKPRRVVTYAIENNDIETLLSPDRKLPGIGVRLATSLMRMLCYMLVDRVAFGTSGAEHTYRQIIPERCERRLFLELPSARPRHTSRSTRTTSSAIFVGRIGERKGIPELMRAWSAVEELLPGARLTVVGTGPMSNIVKRWAEERSSSRRVHIQVAHDEVYDLLTEHDVLVAPSKPHGRWREQVGLPIVEALSLGLTVVTTDQTGLAAWLTAKGHSVLPTDDLEARLASELVVRLRDPLARESVRAALPRVAGRQEAQQWLHQPI